MDMSNLSLPKKIAVIAVALIFVVMLMMPAFSSIFAGDSTDDAQATESATESVTESVTEAVETMDTVDAKYGDLTTALEAKLSESPDDIATIASLGNNYLQWAQAGTAYADDDDSQAHIDDLYTKAIEYYDQYLDVADSCAVMVDKAICLHATGHVEDAIKLLDDACNQYDGEAISSVAWYTLGIFVQNIDADVARADFNKAKEVDPDNIYGYSQYADLYLQMLDEQESTTESTTESVTESTTESVTESTTESTTEAKN